MAGAINNYGLRGFTRIARNLCVAFVTISIIQTKPLPLL